MNNKQLFAIILAIIIAGLIISIGCFYGLNQNKQMTNNTTNITNNTTDNITNNTDTQEMASNTNNGQNGQKLEFNGKTHEQNVLEAQQSRDAGGQWAGATDEEIEELVSKEEREGGRI